MWGARLMACSLLCFLLTSIIASSSLFIPAAAHAALQDQPQLLHLTADNYRTSCGGQINSTNKPQGLQRLKRMAELDYDGDYSPSANVDAPIAPPPPISRRLLQDYSPMANERSTPTPGRKLLQDYSPMANDRSPTPGRKLLQDYSPMANERTPTTPSRKLLQDYSPTPNQDPPTPPQS